jgi:hypothetical protein
MDFKKSTIRQIRIWAWLAAVAGLFFIWRFTPSTILDYAFVTGEITMFTIAVIWWWWAMHTMRKLVKHWDETKEDVKGVLDDVKEMKSIVIDTLSKDK